jgi:hypothetical protein
VILLTFSCGFLWSGCSASKITPLAIAGDKDASAMAEFLHDPEDSRLKDRKFEQVPAVGATADGKQVFVAWYSGGAAPGPGNYVTLSVSQDLGKTWLNDQLAIYPTDKAYRLFDPTIWRDNKGKMHLFYGSAKNSLIWDGFGGVNAVEINWDGNRISNSNPIRISDGVMSNKPVYLSSIKQTLFPVYIDKPLPGTKSEKSFPQHGVFVYSKMRNNLPLTPYASIYIDEELRIHDEPQLVEISERGEYLAMLRTTKGIYYTKSSDFGKTWTPLQPFTASGPTTSSRFYLGKLSSGNLLLVSNNSTTRNKMSAFLSKDGGKTWPHKLVLDERENVSYPDADQTSDGNIHVVFDRERTGAKDILYCRFTENDILNGNSSAVFKNRVNKK